MFSHENGDLEPTHENYMHGHARATCLQCGGLLPAGLTDYEPRITVFQKHNCQYAGIFALKNHDGWREVVRDAFLSGNENLAIEIICQVTGMVSP